MDTYGVDPTIINGDQMPLHRNESAGQKTLSLKSEEIFVKENYMLSRERATCFTQLCSDPKVDLKLEFVFKGKILEHTSLFQKVSITNGPPKDHIELSRY